jgi:hypothetical protein
VPEYPRIDGPTLTGARDVLRRILRSVAAGEMTADAPAAAQLVRRLEGAELTLSQLTAAEDDTAAPT